MEVEAVGVGSWVFASSWFWSWSCVCALLLRAGFVAIMEDCYREIECEEE